MDRAGFRHSGYVGLPSPNHSLFSNEIRVSAETTVNFSGTFLPKSELGRSVCLFATARRKRRPLSSTSQVSR